VNVFYLHGFASSPASTKVGYFTDRFGEHGIDLRCPDLNQPDFATMTLTRMLDQLRGELTRLTGPATLMAFAKTRPNVTLSLLDDDHQLIASLPRMWSDIRGFVGLTS